MIHIELELKKTLLSSFLFKGISEQEAGQLLESITFETSFFSRNAEISSPLHFEKRVGFIIDGECRVQRMSSDGCVISLNRLLPSDSFGIISVLDNCDDYPTTIIAAKKTRVAFINGDDFISLVTTNSLLSQNVMSFLCQRIRFLNNRIATFSGSSVEKKLANYLLHLADTKGTSTFTFNKANAAISVGAGRASVYRALSALVSSGYVTLKNKMITIDREGLERILK